MISWLAACAAAPPPPPPPPPERLTVLVVVDQWVADAGPLFMEPIGRPHHLGLAVHPYATTQTCVGHTTLATGVLPSTHGMVANRWFSERTDEGPSTCWTSEATKPLAPSLAEAVRREGRPAIAVALKDRAAWPLAGGPDHAIWLDDQERRFRGGSPALDAVASKLDLAPYMGPWTRDDGSAWRGPDGGTHEEPEPYGPGTRPELPLPPISNPELLFAHPGGGDALVDLALAALDATGQRTGLLMVGMSQVDGVGHGATPTSVEYVDIVVRAGRSIDRLLDGLDSRGIGYHFFATADHGATPHPRGWTATRRDAVKDAAALDSAANWLAAKGVTLPLPDGVTDPGTLANALLVGCGHEGPPARWSLPTLYLPELGAAAACFDDALPKAVLGARLPDGTPAYDALVHTSSGKVLGRGTPDLASLVLASTHPDRSGDWALVPAFGVVWAGGTPIGSDHGTPHSYDREVPFVMLDSDGVPEGPPRVDIRDVTTRAARKLGFAQWPEPKAP